MKVAVVARFVPEYRHHLYSGLVRSGHDVTVIHGPSIPGTKFQNVAYAGIGAWKDVELPSRIVSTPLWLGGVKFPISGSLWPALRRCSPDVLLLEGASNIGLALPSMSWARRHGVATVWWTLGRLNTRREGVLEMPRRIWDMIAGRVESRADHWLGYSSVAMAYFADRGYSSARCHWAGNVGDVEPYLRASSRLVDSSFAGPICLFAGSLVQGKRVDLLIQAWRLVVARFPDAQLVIAGSGPSGQGLESLVERLEIAGNVSLLGRVEDDLAERMAAADLFVLPGLGGVALAEAMAAGTAVVTSDADGTERDLVIHGVTGWHFQAGSVTSLADTICEAISDSDALRRAGEAGRRTISENFMPWHHVARVESALLTAAGSAGGS